MSITEILNEKMDTERHAEGVPKGIERWVRTVDVLDGIFKGSIMLIW